VQLADRVPNGDALTAAMRDSFTVGMRYAVISGAVILLIGALFVWFHGATRTEEEEVAEPEFLFDLIPETESAA
jgi:hypothetical protein